MQSRLDSIIGEIVLLEHIKIIEPFVQKGEIIYGAVNLSGSSYNLDFDVEILPQYPFQNQDTETIRFINKSLIQYNHVNQDGSVSIHTPHSPILRQKLNIDFAGLQYWIIKYYVNRESDLHYEHIIVNESVVNESTPIYLFTEVDHNFTKGEYGILKYDTLSIRDLKKPKIVTNIVHGFINNNKELFKCNWSNFYEVFRSLDGIYLFIDNPPIVNRRFIIQNWLELEPFVNQGFYTFLYNIEKKNIKLENESKYIPLFIGYRINLEEIHWQCAIISIDKFPYHFVKNHETSKYERHFIDEPIIWNRTFNCSYKYFFGRGKLHEKFTNSKVLIIGIGAIGSIVATTLVRGGCTKISLIDYDIKNPDNICRSEYSFFSGIVKKTDDLTMRLIEISPFVEVRVSESLTHFLKIISAQDDSLKLIEKEITEYDLIFDCTTDNDIAYILDKMKIESEIINLSITNHANELVCAVKPDLYLWLNEIFKSLSNDTEDLYNPSGCWSPTFKASYNDISALVQYALKHINYCFEKEKPLRNFKITASKETGEINLKLKQN